MRKYLIISALFGLTSPASAATVGGSVDVSPRPWVEADTPKPPGYVRLPVTAPAPAFERRGPASALFLQVVESLPIQPPADPVQLRLSGARITPEIVSCAVDERLSFLNQEDETVEIEVGDQRLGPVESGQSVEWTCAASSAGSTLKAIRVVQEPWVRASVFVGEVGVAALPTPDGRFSMSAPQGSYELLWIGRNGIIERRAVTVADRPVELKPFVRREASPP